MYVGTEQTAEGSQELPPTFLEDTILQVNVSKLNHRDPPPSHWGWSMGTSFPVWEVSVFAGV